MKVDDIPCSYAYCYATKEQCDRCEHCLRHHAAQMNENDLAKPKEVMNCISPTYVKRVANGEACGYYRSDKPIRFARGMKSIFSAVPKGMYRTMRIKVMNCFTSERAFYRAQNGSQLISPAEQEMIASVFKAQGLPAPVFDKYESFPDW